MSVIRGTTITTPIARHAVADDTAVSRKPWSSKNTVDKLCPTFTESGSVVVCEPVEGYPLDVVTKYNPNLIPVDLTDYSNWKWDNTGAFEVYDTPVLPSGYYTMYCPEYALYIGTPSEEEAFSQVIADVEANTPTTFYHSGGVLRIADISSVSSYGEINIKLEAGTEYTGTNYVAPTQITRCGKNLGNVSRMANNCATVTDGVVKVEYLPNGARMSNYVPVYIPKGTYAILSARLVDCSEPKSTYAVGGIYAITKTGKYHGIHTKNTEIGGIMQTTLWDNDDDIVKLQAYVGQFETTGSYIIMDNIQLEIGTKRTACEPYNGGTFTPGEKIPALPGTNTLYADSGVLTVTGKADPVAIIDKLTKAILSLGGNV